MLLACPRSSANQLSFGTAHPCIASWVDLGTSSNRQESNWRHDMADATPVFPLHTVSSQMRYNFFNILFFHQRCHFWKLPIGHIVGMFRKNESPVFCLKAANVHCKLHMFDVFISKWVPCICVHGAHNALPIQITGPVL